MRSMNSCALAARAARSMSDCGTSFSAYAMFERTESWNSTVSWVTMP
jgi:hypothetical protein